MTEKTDLDKLRILLPHWIAHNHEHAHEFMDWAEKARTLEYADAAADIEKAAQIIHTANEALQAALKKLGGAMEMDAEHEHQRH